MGVTKCKALRKSQIFQASVCRSVHGGVNLKKDKNHSMEESHSKSERKAAFISKLKSLIGPLVIMAVIAVGVVIVIFWKEEPEPVEIIKVNSYEGNEKEFVLENDKLKFVMDASTTQFSLTVKDTGKVWYSNPPEGMSDPLALTVEKDKLQSTLVLTYSTINGVDTLYPNYSYSIEKGVYDIEADGDHIKVLYSIGDTEKEFIVPPVISADRMEELLGNMSNSDALTVKDYYKKYDINNLGKRDNREELLENYPILETEIVYIIRSSVKDNIKNKLEGLFADAGYTIEEYAEDKLLDLTQTISDKPIFNVNINYRLEGGDLMVEIPMEEIEYREDYPLLYLSVLPYFGAGGTDAQGYLLVPEGGGAIIDFNNGKVAQNSYYANVYGWDNGQDRTAVVHETRTYYNVFGIAQDDDAFLCILEKGAPYASIQADIAGRNNSYNYVNAVYNMAHREQYDVADRYTGRMFVYEETLPQESLISRYRFTNTSDYVEMANIYHDYLEDSYEEYLARREDTQAPVALEILGAADKVKQIMGIPVSKPLKLTTYKEAQEILAELSGEGMENVAVKLTGWMNGGVKQKILKDADLVGALGSKKDLKSLTAYAADNGMKLYLNGITNYAYDSGMTDGFLEYRDAARFVSDEKAELSEFSTVYYGKIASEDIYFLLKTGLIDTMAANLAETASNYQANVSFQDIGKELSADYTNDAPVSRQAAMELQETRLKAIKNSGLGIMVNMGNDYAVPYSDIITNMDLHGSEYTILDRTVPFYQIALHGYVDYTGESLNLAQNYEQILLESAEYGAGLSFTLMKESSFVLQNTKYTQYFGADYSAWHDRMVEIYTRYNCELGHTFNQRMIGHEHVTQKLTCTTYEDGTKVYVNYGDVDQTVDGTVVPARDYVVIR